MKKLIVTALLAGMSISAYGEVYKCQVDGKTVYQQSPCAGQVDTAQPVKIVDSGKQTSYWSKELDAQLRRIEKSAVNNTAANDEAKKLREGYEEAKRRDEEKRANTILINPDFDQNDKNKYIDIAREAVTRQLKDPVSAEFKEWGIYATMNKLTNEKSITICGKVNARNSFGGYSGFETFIVTDPDKAPFAMISNLFSDSCKTNSIPL